MVRSFIVSYLLAAQLKRSTSSDGGLLKTDKHQVVNLPFVFLYLNIQII